MISPRLTLSTSFSFRAGAPSPTASTPPSPGQHAPPPFSRQHAPPPLSASFSTYAPVAPSNAAPAAPTSFYDVLGIRPGASAREIKAAYRRLALTVHPDAAAPEPAAAAASASVDDFIRVHTAYSTLSDPDKRADYDRRLLFAAAAEGRRAAGLGRSRSFAPPRPGRKSWETDQCW